MYKITKRIISCVLVAVLVIGVVPHNGPLAVDSTVQAATDLTQYSDDYVVDLGIIKSSELLTALNEIIPENKGEKLTFGMLKSYTGAIDLTNYPNINDVTGLGYAVNASSMDLSALTKVSTIYADEFRGCKFKEFKLPAKLVEIQAKAFLSCSNLTTIDLPDTLKKIGGQAFESCSLLDGVTLPDGLEKLGDESFANCKALTKIVIPDNINAALEGSADTEALSGIGASVFNGCIRLESITFGAKMTIIPAGFLQNTYSLTRVNIPENITDIRSSAFSGSGIYSIDLSKNTKITTINTLTFSGCFNLSEVVLPSGLKRIDSNAFNNCVSLLNTEFISKLYELEEIGSYAFGNCGLITAHIPGNVTKIGLYAFADCNNLLQVTIEDFTFEPTSEVTKLIGNYAFSGCNFLEKVVLPEKHQNNKYVDLRIGDYAFYSCYHLEEINFPLSLSQIGEYAFYKASKNVTDWGVENDEFPGIHYGEAGYVKVSDIKTVDSDATEEYLICTQDKGNDEYYQPIITYIEPEKVYEKALYDEYIKNPADFQLKYREYQEIIAKYSEVTGEEIFIYYEPQETVYMDTQKIYEKLTLTSTEDEKYKTRTSYYVSLYDKHSKKMPGDIEFTVYNGSNPAGVIYINPEVVYSGFVSPITGTKINPERKYIRSEKIYDDKVPHEAYLFKDDIKKSAESDYEIACIITGTNKMHVQYVTGLKEVNLGKNLGLKIGNGAFSECMNLEKVILPADMTEIPAEIFKKCSYLIKGGFNGSEVSKYKCAEDDWYGGLETVVMSNDVTRINDSAFEECSNLRMDESNNLPKQLVYIGEKAYSNCASINKVLLPSKLEAVDNNAFSGCSKIIDGYMEKNSGLIDLDVSGASSLQYIGQAAFSKCAFNLFEMNNSASVNEILTGTFSGCQYLQRVMLSPSVAYVGKTCMNLCYRLESVHAPDTCLLDSEMCMGVTTEKLPPSLPNYSIENADGSTVTYFHTRKFVLSLDVQKPKVSVRENGRISMPLSTVDSDGYSHYKLIKIGENSSYIFDRSTGVLSADIENEYISPTINFEAKKTIEANNYKPKAKSEAMWGITLKGISEVTDLKVVVEEELRFIISKTHNVVITSTPNAQYSIDVTKNPCKEILYDDRVYVDYNGKKTVSPNFVAKYPDGNISDKISWKVEAGDDLITVAPSEDGFSAEIIPTKNGYGTASVKVTAGEVYKIIYVNVAVPSSKIILSDSSMEVSVGATETLGATLSYSSINQENAVLYGDNIKYTSSDETIVKVVHYIGDNGVNYCKVIAVGYGEAVVTATSMTKDTVQAQCNVYVVAEDVGITATDSAGNELSKETNLTLLNASSATYTYNIDSELELINLSCKAENPDLIEFAYDTKKSTFTIKAKKHGSSKVIVYPSAASPELGGLVFYVQVNADVKDITLTKKEIPVNKTENVFVEMLNTLGETTNSASQDGFYSVTDNRIEFKSSNESVAKVDNYGNVIALKYSTQSNVVTITCTAYRGNDAIATKITNVYILDEGEKVTTAQGELDGEPVVPTGFTCVSEKKGTLLVNAADPGNGQQYMIYIDGECRDTVNSLPAEITDVEPGKHQVYITGYLNGKESEMSDVFDGVIVLDKDPATETVTTTEVVTEKVTEKVTDKITEKVTEKPSDKPAEVVTTKVTLTTKPVENVTKSPEKTTTQVPGSTSAVQQYKPAVTVVSASVDKAKIKSVQRDKNNKKAKVTLIKVKKAVGYQIAYSTNKKFNKKYTKTIHVKRLKNTVKKLKATKKYYFRARAYIVSNGTKVYGKWSKVKTVKVKK